MKALGARILAGEYAYLGEDEDGRPLFAPVSDMGARGDRLQRRDDRRDARDDRRDDRREARIDRAGAPAPAGPRLIAQRPNVSQIKIFAHGALTMLANGAINFNTQALVPFRPTRGVLSATVSLNTVQLTDVKVANRSQIASSSTFPGQMFNSSAQEVYIDLDVISAAIPFQVLGTSVDAQTCVLGWYGNLFEVANLN